MSFEMNFASFYYYKTTVAMPVFFFLIYLFLAALGLCCCMWALSSCSDWGLLFFAVCMLLTAVASLVAEHRL